MTNTTARETRGFQTEVKQLLRLMIHSLYSNREIFLRELISNASDACDKLRFRSLADSTLLGESPELAIDIDFDKESHTLSISDTGIGMTRDEVIAHLGTIAKSGTADFLSQLSGDQQKDAQLIGQFGVGFYSAFIVADRVEVFSRAAGAPDDEGVHWESDGNGEFSIEAAVLPSRGTRVVLHLKEDAYEFADAWKLRSLVKRYSDHIGFPVRLPKAAAQDDAALEREVVNSAQALWTRQRSEIKDEEYNEFYQTVARDFTPPLGWSHNRVEGKREYTTLLYVPSHAPFDLWNRDGSRGLKLYVKRVFILDDAEQFLPLYLRFVKGVVDSSDLPLNVSRELLQTDAEIEAMRAGIARRVLDLLTKLAKDETEKYATFWKEFGQVLKEGIAEDPTNRDRIAKLLRFASTYTDAEKQDQSLDDYLSRAKAGQKHIYYLTAETWNAARHSPHLERLRKHGVEVLLMHDRIDEWMLSYLGEFEGKSFQDVAAADLDLGDLVPSDTTVEHQGADALCGRLAAVLSDRVDTVKATQRLAESPACLVRAAGDLSGQMRRLMEAAGQAPPAQKPTLEINPSHPLIARLEATNDEHDFRDLALLLADQSTLAEGGQLAEPAEFVRRMNRLLLGQGSTP